VWIKRWRFRGIEFDGHECNRGQRIHRHTTTPGIRRERSGDRHNLATAFDDLSTSMRLIERAASPNCDSETTGGELGAEEEEEQLPVRWVAPRLERKGRGDECRVQMALRWGYQHTCPVPVVSSGAESGPARISVLWARVLGTAGLGRIAGIDFKRPPRCCRPTEIRPRYQQAAKVGLKMIL
jgi:hypothetical protein